MEVERFTSRGEIVGEEVLSELFALYSEFDNYSAESGQNTKLGLPNLIAHTLFCLEITRDTAPVTR